MSEPARPDVPPQRPEWVAARGWDYTLYLAAVARARSHLRLSDDDVDECANTVYVALAERFSGPDPPVATEDEFLRYTYRTARNAYFDLLRKRSGRHARPVAREALDPEGWGEDGYRRLHLNRQGMDPDWLRPDIPEGLREQVIGLLPDCPPPPSLRRVAKLMAGGARTQVEVAGLADTSTATVSRRVAEAMEYVQELVRTGVIQLPDDDHGGAL